MSAALAVAGASALLHAAVVAGLARQGVAEQLGCPVAVSLLAPDQLPDLLPDLLQESGSTGSARINLFLYRVAPNMARRNQDPGAPSPLRLPGHAAPGVGGVEVGAGRLPQLLDLYYLVSVSGDQALHAEVLLGSVMQLFEDNPVWARAAIDAALAADAASLAQHIERVAITPQLLPTEALAQLWTATRSPLRLSAGYLASVTCAEAAVTDGQPPLPVLSGRDRGPAGLVPRITPTALHTNASTWTDLVLPDAQMQALRQISVRMRRCQTVYAHWGFGKKLRRGSGVTALFAGESGTGKTLAAEVLADELKLPLYRVDLARVASRHIGETERNLGRALATADRQGAILLFDEAEALFGKRTEVQDSHDRYANIDVSYLMQRVEAHDGLAIFSTRNRASLDPAFTRRLHYVVQFGVPDPIGREAIWRASFPPEAPRDPLQPIDLAQLAQLPLTGGSIRDIAITAAFLAAEDGAAIGMQQVLRAVEMHAARRG
ncbi:MAG: family ATPase [Rhodoferax sp.]|nr:family ATPase [Rhodoferax sp.]